MKPCPPNLKLEWFDYKWTKILVVRWTKPVEMNLKKCAVEIVVKNGSSWR